MSRICISLFYVVCHLNKMLLITGFTLIIVIHVLVNLTNVFHTNSLPSLLSYLLNLLYIYIHRLDFVGCNEYLHPGSAPDERLLGPRCDLDNARLYNNVREIIHFKAHFEDIEITVSCFL